MTERLERLRGLRGQRKLLATALVAGDPHLDATLEYMDVLAASGVDLIELLVPFSDPLYHGRVVQRACSRALREDVGWPEIEELGQRFRQSQPDAAVMISGYYNRFLAGGLDKVAAHLEAGGFDAAMVPDLPWDEAEPLTLALQRHNLDLITMLASSTPMTRVRQLVEDARGLVVWSGHAGGEITDSSDAIAHALDETRRLSPVPVVAAMQISTPEEAARMARHADGVIVGSSLVWLVEGRGDVAERVGEFVRSLKEGMDGGAPGG